MQERHARQMGSLLNIFEKSSFLPASNVDYGNIFQLKERGVDFRLSKNILSSTPKRPKQKTASTFHNLVLPKSVLESAGQCLGSVPPLTYYSYFGEDLVIVSGQYLGSFRSILGGFWVVFGQKKTDWTAQSVIVNC